MRGEKKGLFLAVLFFITLNLGAIDIICHRGANQFAPENSLSAGKKALELGVDWIELDVRKSADGVLYMLHDPILDRTTNGTGFIALCNSKYIDSLDAGSWFSDEFKGEKVPRLSEFLDWAKGKINIYFDIKTRDIDAVMNLIYEKGFEKNAIVWSSHKSDMLKIRKKYPDFPIKGNAGYSLEYLEKLKPQYYEIKIKSLTPERLKMCKDKGYKIMIWELRSEGNQVDLFKKIIEGGYWGVNLDDLKSFLKAAKAVE